jgi:integrase
METACRRGGALALTPHDLDPEQCLIRLYEKGETVRWQPVSPTLMSHLLAHAESRGGLGNGQRLLRYANGRPITKKRYEHLWRRLGEHLAWVETLQVSMYWIRHTTLTWVERNFGFAVAEAYAGHEDNGRGSRSMGAMATYVRAGLPEVATALAALTGEPHPLAIKTPAQAPQANADCPVSDKSALSQ